MSMLPDHVHTSDTCVELVRVCARYPSGIALARQWVHKIHQRTGIDGTRCFRKREDIVVYPAYGKIFNLFFFFFALYLVLEINHEAGECSLYTFL